MMSFISIGPATRVQFKNRAASIHCWSLKYLGSNASLHEHKHWPSQDFLCNRGYSPELCSRIQCED